ncbi:MAG: 3-phosphoglycerate dehydrogenase [Oscillospiraceae bacterium]|nr:3-phosphoglycerate dehydrogenase [Oscillospiraceae bacterium]
MYNVKLVNKISKVGLNQLGGDYNCSESAENADAYLVRSAALHDEAFPASLKCIARAGAGVNNIPIDRCTDAGIVVFNTPGANANAVKELTLCGLLLASRKIKLGNKFAESLAGTGDEMSKLVEKGKSQFAGPELKGKTLGVIGLGAIGGPLANIAVSLGMTVYGYDPFLSVDAAWTLKREIHHATDLKTIFEVSDYISVHVPATADTKGMLCAKSFEMMKDGVRIVNFARGELVNNADMAEALRSGKVAAYVADFPAEELLPLDNFTALPHLGASTPESEDNCAVMAANEVRDYLERGIIKNSVNYPAATLEPTTPFRLCALHKNVAGIVSALSSAVAGEGLNIESVASTSRKEVAYTILDLDRAPSDKLIADLEAKDTIFKVRFIQL